MVVRNDIRNSSHDSDNRKKDIIVKTIIMLLLSFIVFIFAAVAWFAMNKDTDASGMAVRAKDDVFYLRVAEQSSTTYRDVYNQLFNKADSSYGIGDTEVVSGTTYYKTTGGYNDIMWTLEQAETGSDDSIYTVGLNPGSCGTLKFEIVPLVDGNLSIDFDFNLRGFVGEYYTDAEISADPSIDPSIPKSLIEITPTSSTATSDQKSALKYVNGHIIYFTSESNGIYSGYIENNVYHWSTTTAVANTAIPVEISWIWINTIDQVILKSTDGGNTPLISDDSTDRGPLLDYIKANKNNIFDNLSDDISSLTYTIFKNNLALQSNMENTYNAADQIIGTNLEYVLFEMTANLSGLGATPTPTPTPGA